jgi:hypothetical protein
MRVDHCQFVTFYRGLELRLRQPPAEVALGFGGDASKQRAPGGAGAVTWGFNEAGGDLGDRGPPRTNVSTRQRHILRPNGIKVTGAA